MHRPVADGLRDIALFLNDPRQDERLLAEAEVALDPGLMPLLVRLASGGPGGPVKLAAELGRDHSTLSRQLSRLEALGLAERAAVDDGPGDRRARVLRLTPEGEEAAAALGGARARLLDRALAGWSAQDRAALATLLPRFARALWESAARA